jgi:hypothetical protein
MNHLNSPEESNPGLGLSISIPMLLTAITFIGCYILLSVARGEGQTYPSLNCNIVVSGTVQDVTCAGHVNGSIDATITGGSAPLTYHWSTGDTTEDIANLSPGIYTLTVYDAQLCSSQAAFVVSEPDPLLADVVCEYPLCGGQPDCCLVIQGGAQPYSVFVYDSPNGQDPPNLPHPVISGNGPPSVPGLTLRTDIIFIPNADSVLCASHVPNGTYYVLVVDHRFCWVWKVVHINASPPMSITEVVTHLSCFGAIDGSIDITVTGGTPTYTYKWNTGAITQDIHNLSSGVYKVTVTDEHQCTVTETLEVLEPQKLNVNLIGQGGSNKMTEDMLDEKPLDESFDIEVFPTITDGDVTMRFQFDASSDIRVRISDMTGRLLFETSYLDITKGDTRQLDLHRLAGGMYMITSNHQETVITHTVVVR